MLLIRRFEEKVEERFRAGELPGFLHVAIGQEAVRGRRLQGAWRSGDVIASTHRAHGHTLAQRHAPERGDGGAVREARGQLALATAARCTCTTSSAGTSARTRSSAAGCRRCVGAALAFKMRGEPRVAVAFFGDGATNIGDVPRVAQPRAALEGAGGASSARTTTGPSRRRRSSSSRSRISTQARRGVRDALDDGRRPGRRGRVRRRAGGARARARGHGPGLPARRDVPARPATTSAIRRSTGPKGELQELRETQDPITKLREKLGLSDEEFEEADREAHEIVEASVEFAQGGHRPEARGRAQERLCLS